MDSGFAALLKTSSGSSARLKCTAHRLHAVLRIVRGDIKISQCTAASHATCRLGDWWIVDSRHDASFAVVSQSGQGAHRTMHNKLCSSCVVSSVHGMCSFARSCTAVPSKDGVFAGSCSRRVGPPLGSSSPVSSVSSPVSRLVGGWIQGGPITRPPAPSACLRMNARRHDR